jgi:hypothetical protein
MKLDVWPYMFRPSPWEYSQSHDNNPQLCLFSIEIKSNSFKSENMHSLVSVMTMLRVRQPENKGRSRLLSSTPRPDWL